MRIDCIYKYRKQDGIKSGFFLEFQTGFYSPLQNIRFERGAMKGKVGLYLCNPNVNAHSSRQPSFTLSGQASNRISGVFFPDVNRPTMGFGDVQGMPDLLLVKESPESLTLFILKGRKTVTRDLLQLWFDGELDEEIAALESQYFPAIGQNP
jgi:hypothetical protein